MDTETLHIIWTGIVTFVVGVILAERKHLRALIDSKADRDDLSGVRKELADFRREQAERHAQSSERLDRILEGMAAVRRLGPLEREAP